MIVRLELAHKRAKVKKVLLQADTVIGRSTECGLRVASNEVSRQHCKIGIADDGVTVRDLGSSNGTFVNGYQLEPEIDYEIAPDSELSLGGIKFFVRFREPKVPVMQSDGLGSTVDLKPPEPPQEQLVEMEGEETKEVPSHTPPEPQATSDNTQAAEPISPAATDEEADAGPVDRRGDGNSRPDSPDVELSTHGDSAILERNENPATIKPIPSEADEVPTPAEDSAGDDAMASEDDASPSQSDDDDANEDHSEDDVTAFLNQVADEPPAPPDDDEQLGDFFKQLDK